MNLTRTVERFERAEQIADTATATRAEKRSIDKTLKDLQR